MEIVILRIILLELNLFAENFVIETMNFQTNGTSRLLHNIHEVEDLIERVFQTFRFFFFNVHFLEIDGFYENPLFFFIRFD